MNTKPQTLGQLLRERLARPQPATWRNRAWRYQAASTHSDSSAFRERQIARGLRINRKGVSHD